MKRKSTLDAVYVLSEKIYKSNLTVFLKDEMFSFIISLTNIFFKSIKICYKSLLRLVFI